MSSAAIQRVVQELQELPEADREVVVNFVQALKRKRKPKEDASPRRGRNPALKMKKGRLVFTGKLEAPYVDWVRVVREERDQEIMRQALGPVGPA